jgi:hypothetical protein
MSKKKDIVQEIEKKLNEDPNYKHLLTYKETSKYRDPKKSVEYFDKASLTVQEHNISLKTLLERYTRGQNVAVYNPHFDFDSFGDGLETLELDKLDTMERLELANNLKDSIKEHRIRLEMNKYKVEVDEEKMSTFEKVAVKLKQLLDTPPPSGDENNTDA